MKFVYCYESGVSILYLAGLGVNFVFKAPTSSLRTTLFFVSPLNQPKQMLPNELLGPALAILLSGYYTIDFIPTGKFILLLGPTWVSNLVIVSFYDVTT